MQVAADELWPGWGEKKGPVGSSGRAGDEKKGPAAGAATSGERRCRGEWNERTGIFLAGVRPDGSDRTDVIIVSLSIEKTPTKI